MDLLVSIAELTECQAFSLVFRIGSPRPLTHKRVLPPPSLVPREGHTRLWERGRGDPIRTKGGSRVRHSRYSTYKYNPSLVRVVCRAGQQYHEWIVLKKATLFGAGGGGLIQRYYFFRWSYFKKNNRNSSAQNWPAPQSVDTKNWKTKNKISLRYRNFNLPDTIDWYKNWSLKSANCVSRYNRKIEPISEDRTINFSPTFGG